jgi:hypothetical protein
VKNKHHDSDLSKGRKKSSLAHLSPSEIELRTRPERKMSHSYELVKFLSSALSAVYGIVNLSVDAGIENMRIVLFCTLISIGSLVPTTPARAVTEWRISHFSSYVELSDGTVFCGDKFASFHEGRTGNVCAGGQYDSFHEGRTGELACGGLYDSFHEGRTGNVCAGGQYDSFHEGRTGELACGGLYDSFHEGRTGNVCAGGRYDSFHEGRTGEVACGGKYASFHKSSSSKVCFGGHYDQMPSDGPNLLIGA